MVEVSNITALNLFHPFSFFNKEQNNFRGNSANRRKIIYTIQLLDFRLVQNFELLGKKCLRNQGLNLFLANIYFH